MAFIEEKFETILASDGKLHSATAYFISENPISRKREMISFE